MRVARLVGRRIGRPSEPFAHARKGRLDRDALVGRLDLTVAAQLAHQPGGLQRRINFTPAGVEVQDAALQVIVRDAGFAPQLAQGRPAIEPEVDDLRDVVAGAGRHSRRNCNPHSHWSGSGRKRNSSGASSRASHFKILSGADGLAHGSAWLTETWTLGS